MLLERLGDDVGSRGEDGVELGIGGGRDGAVDVALVPGMDRPGAGRQRGVVADDGVERIDVQLDEVAGVLGDVPRLGDDEGHRLAGEADVALGQAAERPAAGAALEVDPRLLHVAVQVGAGEHGDHAGQLAGGRDVDAR